MAKFYIYKDAYMNGVYCLQQEKPDICDSMEAAIITFIDAVKHLTGKVITKTDIETFEDMNYYMSVNCGNGLTYKFFIEIKY